MSPPRLTFLYPHLYKSAIVYECNLPHRPPRARGKRAQTSRFSTSTQHKQESYAQRYGTAAEPQPPPLVSTNGLGGKSTLASTIEKEVKAPIIKMEERKPDSTKAKEASSAKDGTADKIGQTLLSNKSPRGVNTNSKGTVDPSSRKTTGNPLQTVLQTETPTDKQPEKHKPPHLHAPLYVHHFDTFTLVRNLQKGGFTEGQSVNLMKAVRSLLALNLEVAREGLVSKSDIENVHAPLGVLFR